MSDQRRFNWKSGRVTTSPLLGFWQLPKALDDADPQIPNYPVSTAAGESVTAEIAWTEESDSWSIAAALTVTTGIAWVEADDAFALAGTISVTVALSWTESDDAWVITGDITNPVYAEIAWTEEDDAFVIGIDVQSVTPPAVSTGGGGGSSWLGATREEERRLLAQIEAVLKETLSPKKAEPVLRTLAGVEAVATARHEIERIALEARADEQMQEVLADVQAKIAIFVARQKRVHDDEEMMMVL